jgi:quercetin dioxygenase-like cupin family protein
MKIQNYRDVAGIEAAPGVVMHVVSGPAEGAPTYVMRLFEIQPGSGTPHHAHPWEHELFLVAGDGMLVSGETRTPLKPGDAITVLPNELHSFRNAGDGLMTMICTVPLVDGVMPGMQPAGQD